MPEPSAALTYSSYLALDEVLAAQRPKTDEHDELLFIVIHQVYELWFKELLHEGAQSSGASRTETRRTRCTPSSACSRSSRPSWRRSTSSRR